MNTRSTPAARLLLVGDVLVDRAEPGSAFRHIRTLLHAGDLLFGNCEAVYTADPVLPPHVGAAVIADPVNVSALRDAGFTVMSCANNHIGDGGHAAMFETADHLRAAGIAPAGIGRDLEEARAPALVQASGARVAVLALASVFPYGYEARPAWPGLAPLRAYNLYQDADPYNWVPGALPLVRTFTDEQDIAALRASIGEARDQADVVLVSCHWGDWTRPAYLTDHEVRTAHLAIDFGADIVVGHHHHTLRGIEWYRNRPIFYGLGHLVFDMERIVERIPKELFDEPSPGKADESYGLAIRPGWPQLPMHPDARMTIVAWADVNAGEIAQAGVVPCLLNELGEVAPVAPSSPEGQRVLDYLRWTCTEQRLQTTFDARSDCGIGGFAGALALR